MRGDDDSKITDDLIESIMKELDNSESGTISYNEWIAGTINLSEYLTP
jgi:Ca2+-binding EF-hand superfamily protein